MGEAPYSLKHLKCAGKEDFDNLDEDNYLNIKKKMCEALRYDLYNMVQSGQTSDANKTACFAKLDQNFSKSCVLFDVITKSKRSDT